MQPRRPNHRAWLAFLFGVVQFTREQGSLSEVAVHLGEEIARLSLLKVLLTDLQMAKGGLAMHPCRSANSTASTPGWAVLTALASRSRRAAL